MLIWCFIVRIDLRIFLTLLAEGALNSFIFQHNIFGPLQVLVNKDEVEELESMNGILRPSDERELNRIKPNPTVKVQPIFMDLGPTKKNPAKSSRQSNKALANGLCLEITGRVQHDGNELKYLMTNNQSETDSNAKFLKGSSSSGSGVINHDNYSAL